jgi:soluble lytic murein transglycosylase-like protein
MTALVVAWGAPALAQSFPPETAALPPFEAMENEAALPRILTDADIARYHRVGNANEDQRWADADRDIARLTDPILVGYLLADRYLHPRYKSSYDELKAWLDKYGDHPDAWRIYKMATARKPAKAKPPRVPTYIEKMPPADSAEARAARATSRQGQDLLSRARLEALNGRPEYAQRLLEGPEAARLIDAADLDAARGYIASRYFYTGAVNEAHALAVPAAKRSKSPTSLWTAGLASYRLGRHVEAAEYFEALYAVPRQGEWSASAAAFWAARANMVGQRPQRVHHFLGEAARYPNTFYGLLAHRLLGTKPDYHFGQYKLTTQHITRLMREEPARRAFALLQMKEDRRAEMELRPLAYRGDTKVNEALVAVAERITMPSLALRVALSDRNPETGESRFPGALYPIPGWKPAGGFKIDRALIYAFMRQESAFNVRATSTAGARGLMQLMPATASMMAKERLRGDRSAALYDPELNLTLGQRYLVHLLEHETVQGDLFRLAAAYNGGPGNLAKWDRRTATMEDSLMFIESIPANETRNFIERVLANLWIYRLRLGQDSPSLDAIAAGERPLYEDLDAKAAKLVKNGRN